jgi:hypothetical protein
MNPALVGEANMGSTVRSRPSHYETLGLASTAGSDEIARAFAREISDLRPRAFGGLAEVGIAYETLRNPVKRRAYDISLGLGAEPRASYAPKTLRIGAQFISSAPGRRAERPVEESFARPAPVMKPSQPELPAEPRTASFIAESLRNPPGPVPRDDLVPGARPQPNPPRRPEPGPGPRIDDRILHRAEKVRLADAEDRPVDWKRPAIIIGATVAAVALLGALAGWQAGHEPQQPQAEVTAALPPPKPRPAAVLPPAPASRVADAQSLRLPRAAVTLTRARRAQARPRPAVPDEQFSQGAQFEPVQPEEQANAQAVTESRPVEAAAALPLPNAVIARTIERIGYACGKVASTTAVGGESRGAFKVSCTSGLSYQATPVRGRYHFRRLGSR